MAARSSSRTVQSKKRPPADRRRPPGRSPLSPGQPLSAAHRRCTRGHGARGVVPRSTRSNPMSKEAAAAVQSIPLVASAESKLNPRQSFDRAKLEELAQSIREKGVLVPILVRPVADGYEVAYGARRLRAAELAGLEAIPATVRDLTDAEVLEVALLENVTREDINELDEGAAYLQLHEKHGRSVEEIAAKTGKSADTIRARMKLCDLTKPGREALLEGKLDASKALLIARVPNTLQAKLTKELTAPRYNGASEGLSYREAQELVRKEYMLELKSAPFDIKDAELLIGCSACVNCERRTGAQPEL